MRLGVAELMTLRISITRFGVALRKSSSDPALMSLVETSEDDFTSSPRLGNSAELGFECSKKDLYSGISGEASKQMDFAKMRCLNLHSMMPCSLRHVDSMELIAQHKEGLTPEATREHLAANRHFEGHSSFLSMAPTRACSLPHVDSCELINKFHDLGNYDEDDLTMRDDSTGAEDLASRVNAKVLHAGRKPHLAHFRHTVQSNAFHDAVCGL